MSGRLHLTIATPAVVLVDANDVLSVRAEDESGSFGILPGHADLLTVLPASVLRWRDGNGAQHYCALQGGVFSVRGGLTVAVACRQGVIGGDLAGLEADVAAFRGVELEAVRGSRVEETRLHARAVRQLMHLLRPGPGGTIDLHMDGNGR